MKGVLMHMTGQRLVYTHLVSKEVSPLTTLHPGDWPRADDQPHTRPLP